MRTPEIFVHTLVWLPAVIAVSRKCDYRWLICAICLGLAVLDLYDVAKWLSNTNARHSMYLFIGMVLTWLPVFILSIYARISPRAP
jgi:hypothetical protein